MMQQLWIRDLTLRDENMEYVFSVVSNNTLYNSWGSWSEGTKVRAVPFPLWPEAGTLCFMTSVGSKCCDSRWSKNTNLRFNNKSTFPTISYKSAKKKLAPSWLQNIPRSLAQSIFILAFFHHRIFFRPIQCSPPLLKTNNCSPPCTPCLLIPSGISS